MNAIGRGATGRASSCARSRRATPAARSAPRCPTCSPRCKAAGFDLIIVETSGIGQGDAAIVPLVDVPMYVMTPEFGAASQLEKIDMLDFAEFVAINKFDRKGAADALRDVAKQVQRNREAFGKRPDEMPVFGTMASRFNDDGVTALYQALHAAPGRARPEARRRHAAAGRDAPQHAPGADRAGRARALPRRDRRHGARLQARRRSRRRASRARSSSCARSARMLQPRRSPTTSAARWSTVQAPCRRARGAPRPRARASCSRCGPRCSKAYAGDEYVVKIRDKEIRTALTHTTLSGNKIRKVALPRYEDHGEMLKWLLLDNVPGIVPVHRRHLRVQARGRGSDAHVRRRGRRVPHQPALQAGLRGHAGQAAVDRVRLGHALRQRPGRCGPTSTARSATRASRSRRSTT